MMDAFTYALREYMKTHGEIPSYWGATSIGWHMQDTDCTGWIVPDGARAVPDTSYSFGGTDCDSTSTRVIRLDSHVSCFCGKYRDKLIQVEGTFSELVTQLLKIDVPSEVQF